MTDFRALCAELIAGIDEFATVCDTGEPFYQLIDRARLELDKPDGEGPDHASLIAFAYGREPWATWLKIGGCLESAHCELSDLMADVLARWGRPAPAPKPIPVSERLPNDGDCLVTSLGLRYCWWASEVYHSGQVRLIWQWKLTIEQHDFDWCFTYWLPASTQFLPTTADSDQST
jgi:hypothetical protein